MLYAVGAADADLADPQALANCQWFTAARGPAANADTTYVMTPRRPAGRARGMGCVPHR